MKDKTEAKCAACGRTWLKRRDTFTGWNGKCKSCTRRNPNRQEVSDNERARRAMYSLLHGYLARMAKVKTARSRPYLGYTARELFDHITRQFKPGMSWEHRELWHIDHIKPVSQFVKEGIEDPKIINALSNLQPLWAFDNLSKKDRWRVFKRN